jgi:thiol-disulfide isomerase/thioredoxin
MKQALFIISAILLVSFISDKQVPMSRIDPLLNRMEKGGDTTYVINFWATWCAPCVKELHYFTEMDSAKADKKVKVILVSLDFKKDISTKLIPFVEKRKIKTDVIFLDETNDNEWIPKVDKEWQGNIPATLIWNPAKNYRKFLPRETTYRELDSLVGENRN